MNIGQRQKVEEAFAAVMAAREGSADSADAPVATLDLVGLCAGDDEVQREVASLLRHLEAAGNDQSPRTRFLDPANLHDSDGILPRFGQDALLRDWGGEAIGQRVDGFTIIGKLGEGGMGIVYVAEQQNPRRTVALKVMRRAVATTSMLRRFEREAQLLGRLNHPGIAQIYAAGIAEISAGGGAVRTPYIAMELVEGASIAEYVAAQAGSTQLVLQLVLQVCDAIQHAHQRGVIHRDLKPANILVAADGQPQVKVLDFGVARPVDDKMDTDAVTLTAHGHLIGTLAYMAPEQLSRGKEDLDVRCDVYALGVILYHLLT